MDKVFCERVCDCDVFRYSNVILTSWVSSFNSFPPLTSSFPTVTSSAWRRTLSSTLPTRYAWQTSTCLGLLPQSSSLLCYSSTWSSILLSTRNFLFPVTISTSGHRLSLDNQLDSFLGEGCLSTTCKDWWDSYSAKWYILVGRQGVLGLVSVGCCRWLWNITV